MVLRAVYRRHMPDSLIDFLPLLRAATPHTCPCNSTAAHELVDVTRPRLLPSDFYHTLPPGYDSGLVAGFFLGFHTVRRWIQFVTALPSYLSGFAVGIYTTPVGSDSTTVGYHAYLVRPARCPDSLVDLPLQRAYLATGLPSPRTGLDLHITDFPNLNVLLSGTTIRAA